MPQVVEEVYVYICVCLMWYEIILGGEWSFTYNSSVDMCTYIYVVWEWKRVEIENKIAVSLKWKLETLINVGKVVIIINLSSLHKMGM